MDQGKIKELMSRIKGKMKLNKNSLILPVAGLILAASAVTGVVGIANADTTTPSSTTNPGGPMQHGAPPAAVGKVTAVNGNDITITDTKGGTTTTYTVDATSATITKHAAPIAQGDKPTSTTITVGQVAVGDMLAVQGTVSGTDITATKIEDGVGGGRGGMRGPGGMGVQGTVTAVNGNTLTVTGKNGTTYTVDATNSTVSKIETSAVSDVSVGDEVGVQGTVSGNTVTAKSIMDGLPAAQTKSGS